MIDRPAIHGQIMRRNLNPPSPWQGFKNYFLEVMSEWIGVRMEQKREEGKMNLYLLGEYKCCNTPSPPLDLLYFKGYSVFITRKHIPPYL